MIDGEQQRLRMDAELVKVVLLWGLLCSCASSLTLRSAGNQTSRGGSGGGSQPTNIWERGVIVNISGIPTRVVNISDLPTDSRERSPSQANTRGGWVGNSTSMDRKPSKEEIVELFSFSSFAGDYVEGDTPVQDCQLNNPLMKPTIPKAFFSNGGKFVDVVVYFFKDTYDSLSDKLRTVYRLNHWVYAVADIDGLELLLLEDHFHFLPVFFMRPHMYQARIAVMDDPRGCLLSLTEKEAMTAIRNLVLTELQTEPTAPADLKEQRVALQYVQGLHQICNEQVFDADGVARFERMCCEKLPDQVICRKVKQTSWSVGLLINLIYVVEVLLILYSPSFIPKSLYSRALETKEYIYHADTPREVDEPIRVRFKVTDDRTSVAHDKELEGKTVSLDELEGMANFKERVKTCKVNTVYEAVIQYVRLCVKPRRLLDENTIPVGLFQSIYYNLCLCRIKHLSPVKKCCRSYAVPRVRWYDCGLFIGKSLLLGLCTVPWLIRLLFYFRIEQYDLVFKSQKAAQLGLQMPYSGSLTPYLTPLHVLFVMTYIVLSVDFLVYGLINKAMKEQFSFVLRKTLREMREQTRRRVFAAFTRGLVRPFEKFGVLGIFLALPFAVVLVAILPLAVLVFFPSLNLTSRLLSHLLFYLLPATVTDKCSMFVKIKEEAREAKHVTLLQLLVIPMCLVSFWFFTLLLVEAFAFLAQLLVLIMIAIIIDAEDSMPFVSILFLISMYARSTFKDIHEMYLGYHKQIHGELLRMEEEEIARVATKDEAYQDNTAFHVRGSRQKLHSDLLPQNIRLVVKNSKLKWEANGLLVFLDRRDMPYTPQKFFHQTILFNHWGAPGPVYASLVKGLWSFSKILLFLFFVLTVISAYASYFTVSATNKTLATIATGFIPQIFKTAFSGRGAGVVDRDSVQFKAEFSKAIEDFKQTWPVSDIGGKRPGLRKEVEDDDDDVVLCLTQAWRCFMRSLRGLQGEEADVKEEEEGEDLEVLRREENLTNDKEEVIIREVEDDGNLDVVLYVNRQEDETVICF